jgi:hypothetical protein
MTFDDLRAYCKTIGDEPAAVEDFIAFMEMNISIFEAFWASAQSEALEQKPNVMRCMAKMRERGVECPNSISPGLARMANLKAKRRIFKTNRMTTFSERWAA